MIELFPGWLTLVKSFRFCTLQDLCIFGFTCWWMVAISWLPVSMFLVRGSWWWYNGLSHQGQLLRRLSWWRIPRHQNRAGSPWREMNIAVQISNHALGSSSPRELITFFLPWWLGRGVFLLSWAEFCILVPEVYVTKPILVVSGRLNKQLNYQFLDRFHTRYRHEPHNVDVNFFMVWKHSDFTCTYGGEKLCTPKNFVPRLGYTYEVTFKVWKTSVLTVEQ